MDLLRRYPFLQDETNQVFLFLIAPIFVLLLACLADITFRKRIISRGTRTDFRPSLTVQGAWVIMPVAFLGYSLFTETNLLKQIAGVLAALELARTFPSAITVANAGIQWRWLWRRISLRWEDVTCFVKQDPAAASVFVSDFRLYGGDGQKLEISKTIYSGTDRIAAEIGTQLRARNIAANYPEPRSAFDSIHIIFGLASIALVFFERFWLR